MSIPQTVEQTIASRKENTILHTILMPEKRSLAGDWVVDRWVDAAYVHFRLKWESIAGNDKRRWALIVVMAWAILYIPLKNSHTVLFFFSSGQSNQKTPYSKLMAIIG